MTTYADLKLTQQFMIPDEGEFSFTKLRDYARVNETGVATSFAPEQVVEPVGPEPRLNDSVTEIERLVITMLHKHGSTLHPALGEWMRRLCSDPGEFRWMDNFALAETVTLNDDTTPNLADFCRSQGFVIARREWDRDSWGGEAIQNYRPRGEWRTLSVNDRVLARYDRAAYHLACALREYRENGRPDGDQTSPIMGMGALLLNITTSLAAAAYEYHAAIVNLTYDL